MANPVTALELIQGDYKAQPDAELLAIGRNRGEESVIGRWSPQLQRWIVVCAKVITGTWVHCGIGEFPRMNGQEGHDLHQWEAIPREGGPTDEAIR